VESWTQRLSARDRPPILPERPVARLGLAVLRSAEDRQARVYVANKEKACSAGGIRKPRRPSAPVGTPRRFSGAGRDPTILGNPGGGKGGKKKFPPQKGVDGILLQLSPSPRPAEASLAAGD